ncbi:uncharacterized protein LOC129927267 [Biomphalaria glabrata]|uniref:Uncharacterized protein LOC129927267 n=1 Tax=Biomphalaria glabrata TaxID=6526 RepID=A0A9W3AWB2_BIOGL|nr:uncharacterized protein LOC129927267 [Biomphalaria glabrata]XP_055891512.1 uncharacterized protein LOC129927267 [Biomphalaria glabrata]
MTSEKSLLTFLLIITIATVSANNDIIENTHPRSADFLQALRECSQRCQTGVLICQELTTITKTYYSEEKFCNFISYSQSNLSIHDCLLRSLYCSSEEFENLSIAACSDVISTLTPSSFTTSSTTHHRGPDFLQALRECSQRCQTGVLICQELTTITKTYYSEEKFCNFISYSQSNLSIHDCLLRSLYCSSEEFENLSIAACSDVISTLTPSSFTTSSTTHHRGPDFLQALRECSQRCQTGVLICQELTTITKTYYSEEKFCNFISYSQSNLSIHDCLLRSLYCSSEEFENLSIAACSDVISTLTPSSFTTSSTTHHRGPDFLQALRECSQRCQTGVLICQELTTITKTYYSEEKFCNFISYSQSNLSIHDCLLRSLYCSSEEFENLSIAACSDVISTLTPSSFTTSSTTHHRGPDFLQALRECSQRCQTGVLICQELTTITKTYYSEEKFCNFISYSQSNLSIHDCLLRSLYCSSEEFENLSIAACSDVISTLTPSSFTTSSTTHHRGPDFLQALRECSQRCQTGVLICQELTTITKTYYSEEKFCNFISYSQSNLSIHDCLLRSLYCSSEEFENLSIAACSDVISTLTPSSFTTSSTTHHRGPDFLQALRECSQRCQTGVLICQELTTITKTYYSEEKFCNFISYSQSNLSIHDCLLRSLYCSSEEFENLSIAACSDVISTLTPSSFTTSSTTHHRGPDFLQALRECSQRCQT